MNSCPFTSDIASKNNTHFLPTEVSNYHSNLVYRTNLTFSLLFFFSFGWSSVIMHFHSSCKTSPCCLVTSQTTHVNSQNHRTLGVGRDLCGSSSPTPPCRSSVAYSRLHRILSRWVLNISREGDSTTSLGSLFQCSVTLRGKKFFLMFRWNFLCFSLRPLPLVLLLCTTEKSLALSS